MILRKLYNWCKAFKDKDAEVYLVTVGFWKHGKRLISAWLRKGNIPKNCRLMLVENQYKKSGDNKPDYIGYFIDVKDEAAKDISRPYDEEKEGGEK